MKNLKLDTNHVVEAIELLNRVEGGVSAGGKRLDTSSFIHCNFFVCSIALYGSVIDPIRFEIVP